MDGKDHVIKKKGPLVGHKSGQLNPRSQFSDTARSLRWPTSGVTPSPSSDCQLLAVLWGVNWDHPGCSTRLSACGRLQFLTWQLHYKTAFKQVANCRGISARLAPEWAAGNSRALRPTEWPHAQWETGAIHKVSLGTCNQQLTVLLAGEKKCKPEL